MTLPSEFDFIAKYLRPLATDPASLGLLDDAAVLTGGSGDMVVTKDALASGVHFFADDPPAAIARKALRVNLSDLAAMGAVPRGYFLALALPQETDLAFLESFASGLEQDQAEFGLSLLGGDTLRAPGGLLVCVTMIGDVPSGGGVRRSGACSGDLVIATGTLGDAALGLRLCGQDSGFDDVSPDPGDVRYLRERYHLPRPRLGAAGALRRFAHAAIDVSDGLVADLGHICAASQLAARIDIAAIPVSQEAARVAGSMPEFAELMCTHGDDYEIVACVAPAKADAYCADLARRGMTATVIGEMCAGAPEVQLHCKGEAVTLNRAAGHRHF